VNYIQFIQGSDGQMTLRFCKIWFKEKKCSMLWDLYAKK